MELQEILKALERCTGGFPREAIREAVARREEITPELLRILEETAQHIEVLEDDPEYMAYEWAMFLLAQFKEERAYPLIVDLVSGPAKLIDDALGETVPQYLNRILASVYDGDMGTLDRLIEDPEVYEYVRSAALDVPVVLAATGRKPREEAIAYFRSLFHRGLGPDEAAWTWLVYSAAALAPGELMDEIRRAFEEHPIDSFIIDLDEVERSVAEGWDAALLKLQEDPCRQLINDVEQETSWWACWQPQEAPGSAPKPPAPAPRPAPQARSVSLDTYVRPGRKVGRNEPCPCGSGKKYKKCCGA